MADPGADQPQPPLWTWAAAATVAAALIGGMLLLDAVMGPMARAAWFNVARLAGTREATRTIVIIGSSKTRCAIDPDPVFTARLRRLGTDLRVVRMVRDNASAEDLPEVFEAVVRLKPRMVLLETNLMVYEPRAFRGGQPERTDRRQSVRTTIRGVLALFGLVWGDGDNSGTPVNRSCDYNVGKPSDIDDLMATRMQNLAQRSGSSAADRAPYLAFLRALHSEGTETALLRFPTRPDSVGQLPAALVRDADAIRAQLEHDEDLAELRVAVAVAPADFEDAGHMGDDARSRVSAWLAEHLAARLALRSGA
jgi:hypothetical protein